MILAGAQLEKEYERQLNIIQSDRYFDCIVHHTVNDIPEDELIRTMYNCKKRAPAAPVVGPHPYIQRLNDEGVLDRFMVPGDDRWHYELTPVAKHTFKKMLDAYGEKFSHPDLETKIN